MVLSTSSATELREIVGAIRHVEATWERREARAEGAFLATWGLGVASIFLFYRAFRQDPEPLRAILGGLVEWVWAVPLALCYLATLALGARWRSIAPHGGRFWRDPFALVGLGGTVVAVLGGRALGHLEWSAALLVIVGAMALDLRLRRWSRATRAVGRSVAAIGLLLGAALFFAPSTDVSHAVAAAYWGLGWGAAGSILYARGR